MPSLDRDVDIAHKRQVPFAIYSSAVFAHEVGTSIIVIPICATQACMVVAASAVALGKEIHFIKASRTTSYHFTP